jgi:YaiO family outer membrane protein
MALCALTVLGAGTVGQTLEQEAREAIARKDFVRAQAIYGQLASLRPDNLDYPAAVARLLCWRGDRAASLAAYDDVLRRNPMHYDALVGKAQLYLFARRLKEAEELLFRAELVAGSNTELHLAWARLERAHGRGRHRQFETRARKALELEPANPEARRMVEQAREMGSVGPLEVRLSFAQDHLSQAPVSRMEAVSFGWRGEVNSIHGLYERWDRFSRQGNRAGAAFSLRLGGTWRLRGIGLLSDSRTGVLPKHDHTLGVFRPLGPRIAGGLDFRYLRFPDVRVGVLAPTFEYYFTPKTSVEGTLFGSFLRHRLARDRTAFRGSLMARVNFQAARRALVSGGYARGSQSYFAYTSDRLQSFNSDVFLGRVLVRLTMSASVGFSCAWERRSNGASQQSLATQVILR